METSVELTNRYWELLKTLSDDIKLRLATRLTASVIESKGRTESDRTEEMLHKHLGKWTDDRSAEEVIADLRSHRTAIREPFNLD